MAASPVQAIGARHRVADYFLARGAVGINDAVHFTTMSPVERRAFERLQDKGIVRAAGNDTWFLDETAYRKARRRRGLAVAAGAALGAGLAAALIRRRA